MNRATINALVDAYCTDSKDWQGHALTRSGKKFPFYLIPEGHKRIEDENGYSVIVRKDAADENPL